LLPIEVAAYVKGYIQYRTSPNVVHLSGELQNQGFAASGGQQSQGIPTGQHGFHHRMLALLQELISLWPHRLLTLDRAGAGRSSVWGSLERGSDLALTMV